MHTTFFIIVDDMICCEQIKLVKAMSVNDPSKSYVTSITTDYVNSSENNLWLSVVSTVANIIVEQAVNTWTHRLAWFKRYLTI